MQSSSAPPEMQQRRDARSRESRRSRRVAEGAWRSFFRAFFDLHPQTSKELQGGKAQLSYSKTSAAAQVWGRGWGTHGTHGHLEGVLCRCCKASTRVEASPATLRSTTKISQSSWLATCSN